MLTRSMDENSIDDLNIYFYSTKTNYHFYLTQNEPSFEFQILPGSYTIFIAANVHKDMGDVTKAELSQYRYYAESMETDMPMTATMNVRIMSAMTLPTLEVTRAAAKISYSVTVDDAVASTIKLRSIQFCNVPKMTVLFGNGASSTNKVYYGNDAVIDIDDDKVYSGTYYMLDNCQGDVDTITDQKDKSPENAPECATYMRILADGEGKVLEYIVFLGENSTSNFDVKKNTHHKMNLVIEGENEIDNRVRVYDGLYYGTANCVVYNDTPVTIDVTPYRTSKELNYAYTGIYAGAEYEGVAAKVLYCSTSIDNVTLSLDGNILTVGAQWPVNGGGNLCVAIVDISGDILWSWHVWHPHAPIEDDEYTNAAGEKFWVMGANLGSKEATGSSAGRMGAIYQWGRKDPLWAWNTFDYSDSDASYFFSAYPGIKKNAVTFEDVIKNPTQFIEADDWFGGDDALWGDPYGQDMSTYGWTGEKSVYDPCPEGYRVPNNRTWTGFIKPNTSNTLLVIGSWIYGWHCMRYEDDTVGAWYATGTWAFYYKNSVSEQTGDSPLWVSHPGTEHGRGEHWEFRDRQASIYSYNSYRKYAYQVRCARIE